MTPDIIYFLFHDENICSGYPLEAPRRGASNEYSQHMFSLRNKKDISIFRMKKKCLICCYDVMQADIYGGHLNAQHAGKISDDILKKNIFFISCYKIDFDISCKLSPKETSLFFKKIKKNIINLSPVGFAQ